jgi:NAD(P)H dehydrogenase (quinone)
MPRAHIVYAHPEPRSFVAAMRDTTQAALAKAGWHTTATDLHAAGFNAVASAADFGKRASPAHLVYPLEQRHAWEHGSLATEIADEVRAVVDADLLVLVFPVFWFSVPAQMKGWIDRVFLSGVFYGGRRLYDRGGMVGKHALVVAALGGREHMFGPGALHGELTGMMRHLLQGTLGYAGFSVYEPFFAHHVPYVDDATRASMLMRLWNELQALDTRPVLPMPSLHGFDEQFHPTQPNPESNADA